MAAPEPPARRRRPGEPAPSTNVRAARLAARCDLAPGAAQLLTDELLTVRVTFRVSPGSETPVEIAERLLRTVLPRTVPEPAVEAFADDLVPATTGRASWTLTDVDVRLWFLAWALGHDDRHPASRST